LRVIVSGAGIAGLALAYWLDRIGASSIVIERQPSFQALGHYISLKGNGVEMVRRMGIFDACQARAAPIEETRMYAASGRFLRSEHTTALARTLGGYILFRRADLQAALYDLARERAATWPRVRGRLSTAARRSLHRHHPDTPPRVAAGDARLSGGRADGQSVPCHSRLRVSRGVRG